MRSARGRLRWTLRSVLVLTVGFFALIVPTAAWADVVAQNSGVRGRANWTWNSNGTALENITFGVRDLACDSNDVYVELKIRRSDGYEFYTARRYDSAGCGTAANYSGLRYQSNFYIVRVLVHACVDDAFSNTCTSSEWHYNPYY